jgi:hypothetical protein
MEGICKKQRANGDRKPKKGVNIRFDIKKSTKIPPERVIRIVVIDQITIGNIV